MNTFTRTISCELPEGAQIIDGMLVYEATGTALELSKQVDKLDALFHGNAEVIRTVWKPKCCWLISHHKFMNSAVFEVRLTNQHGINTAVSFDLLDSALDVVRGSGTEYASNHFEWIDRSGICEELDVYPSASELVAYLAKHLTVNSKEQLNKGVAA